MLPSSGRIRLRLKADIVLTRSSVCALLLMSQSHHVLV
jgi:hypothetical protein